MAEVFYCADCAELTPRSLGAGDPEAPQCIWCYTHFNDDDVDEDDPLTTCSKCGGIRVPISRFGGEKLCPCVPKVRELIMFAEESAHDGERCPDCLTTEDWDADSQKCEYCGWEAI